MHNAQCTIGLRPLSNNDIAMHYALLTFAYILHHLSRRAHCALCIVHCALINAAPIVVDSTTRDLGVIRAEDGRVSATFVITNDTSAPFAIANVKTSCGCTYASFSRRQLAKGDTAHVVLTYNPRGRLGEIDGTAAVYTTADPKKIALRLNITGTVVTDDPFPHLTKTLGRDLRVGRDVVVAADLKDGQRRREALPCGNISDHDITLTAAILPPYVSISTSPSPIPAGAEADIIFSIDATAAPAGKTSVPIMLRGAGGKPSESIITLFIRK